MDLACRTGIARLSGRTEVKASNTSATATILAARGIWRPDRPQGIALAVESLVVIAGDQGRHFQEAAAGAAGHGLVEDVGAHHRVLLHDGEFIRRQRPGLQQDAVGNAHLADVVQGA